MPREDCTPVTGKSVYTYLTSQEHCSVFGWNNFVFTSVPSGNVKGRRPDFSISSSTTIGFMVGLFVFMPFFSHAINSHAINSHANPSAVLLSFQGVVIVTSFNRKAPMIRALLGSDQVVFAHTQTFIQNYL